jgi:hypothetical protein
MLVQEYQGLRDQLDRPDRLDQKETQVRKDHVALLENKVQQDLRDLRDLREVLAPVLQKAMCREFCKLTELVDRLRSLLVSNHEEDR